MECPSLHIKVNLKSLKYFFKFLKYKIKNENSSKFYIGETTK